MWSATEELLVRPVPRRRRRRWLAWGLACFTAVVFVDAIFGEAGALARMRAQQEYARQLARLEALRTENARLARQVRDLDRNARTIETIARRDLGLVKPGEVVFLIREQPQAASAIAARVPQNSPRPATSN